MIKIVGFQHKEGKFDDQNGKEVKYNNIVFYYNSDVVRDVVGMVVGEIKIAFENCKAITGFDFSSLPELLDKNVDLSYIPMGKYQQLSSIRIVEPEKAAK